MTNTMSHNLLLRIVSKHDFMRITKYLGQVVTLCPGLDENRHKTTVDL